MLAAPRLGSLPQPPKREPRPRGVADAPVLQRRGKERPPALRAAAWNKDALHGFSDGSVLRSNDLRISCRRSTYRPHKSMLPLLGHQERRARRGFRPAPACRLHARVRRRQARNARPQSSMEVAILMKLGMRGSLNEYTPFALLRRMVS